ncbi:MAG: protein kinase domain-containing protein [Thermoleophilaceae bacterium]
MAVRTNGQLLAGRYRLIKTLGRGGMATVFLAEDERLGRRVAIKRLHADSPEDMRRRLQREARMGASLNHPNLVSVFDIETYEEGVLVVMEYVEGETLADALRDGPLSERRGLEVISAVASALDHVHEAGVVHRDVKPANVLLGSNGAVKLVDLGIGTAVDHTRITRTGTVLGTPAYMAPEQVEGGELTKAVDTYALATVAFEILSGRKAHQGRTPVEIAHRVATGPPPDLTSVSPEAPTEAAALLKRAMSADPATRPRSAGALAEELEAAYAHRRAQRGRTRATRAMPATRPRRTVDIPPPRPHTAARRAQPRPRPQAARSARSWVPVAVIVGLLALVGILIALVAGGGGSSSKTGATADRGKSTSTQKGGKKSQGNANGNGSGQNTAPAAPPAAAGPALPKQPKDGGDPARGAQLNNQGFQLLQSGDAAGAIPLLQQAVASFPKKTNDLNYAFALFNLGDAYLKAGQPEKAIPVLEKRLKIPNQTGTVQAKLDEARAAAGR